MLTCMLMWAALFQVAVTTDEPSAANTTSKVAITTEPVENQEVAASEAEPAEQPVKLDDAALKKAVTELVKQLQSSSESEREAAEANLVGLGPGALGLLPQVTVDTSEEMRARLNRVRKRLQRFAAEKAVKGSRVTLAGRMKLSAALAALETQTDNRLIDFRDQFNQPQLDPMIEVTSDDAAYWTALESIFDQAGLQLYAYTNQPNTLGYIARSDKLTAAAQAAATELFRLQVIRVQSIRDMRDDNNQGLVVTIEVTWEPRLTPITISQPQGDFTATSDDDQPLQFLTGRGITQVAVQEGISSVELELPFALPPRSVQKIKTLNGTITAMIPGGEMTLEFDDLAAAREVTKGQSGISVVLLRARKNRDLYEFRILLRIDQAAGEMRTQRGWVYGNQAYMLDPEGNKVEYAGLESFRDTADEVGLSYKFDAPDGLEGYKFIYKSPSTMLTVPVDYEIKDVLLP